MRARPRDPDVDHDRDGTRRAGRRLIRDAEALERFAAVDTLIVDKTGTLTEGRPTLTDVVATARSAKMTS